MGGSSQSQHSLIQGHCLQLKKNMLECCLEPLQSFSNTRFLARPLLQYLKEPSPISKTPSIKKETFLWSRGVFRALYCLIWCRQKQFSLSSISEVWVFVVHHLAWRPQIWWADVVSVVPFFWAREVPCSLFVQRWKTQQVGLSVVHLLWHTNNKLTNSCSEKGL